MTDKATIVFHEKTKEFHLYNNEISYIIQVMKNGQLGHLYYGKKLCDRESFSHLQEYAYRDMAPCEYWEDRTFSMEFLMQEYPAYGSSDFRYTAFDLEEENGCRVNKFRYKEHKI